MIPAAHLRRQLFGVEGLWCGGCAQGLERRIGAIAGVEHAAVHFLTRSAFVEWDDARVSAETITAAVAATGYGLVGPRDPAMLCEALDRSRHRLLLRLIVALFFGMWSMLPAAVLYIDPPRSVETRWWLAVFSGIAAMPVLTYAASDIVAMAWRSVRLRTTGMDLLVTIGIAASTLLSLRSLATGGWHVYFDAAVMLVTLLLISRLMDLRLRAAAIDALAALEDNEDECAWRVDERRAVPIAQVPMGTLILVEAGATVPIDGIISDGVSSIDTALLTGEAKPRTVSTGDRVSAGMLNLQRAIHVATDRVAGDRDIDRIGGRIAIELAARRGPQDPTQRLAMRLTLAIPIVGLSILTGALALGLPLDAALSRGLAAMIVLCPCALALVRPLTQLGAVTLAAQAGIRIADPGAIDQIATAGTIVFDKTGTLTNGELRLVAVETRNGWAQEDILDAARAAETGIDHPIARAICAGHSSPPTLGGERLARGARALWRGRSVELTSAPEHAPRETTAVAVLVDGERAGTILLGDELDPTVFATLANLRKKGIAIIIASGDAAGAVGALAEKVGLAEDEWHAAMTPEQKADLILALPSPTMFVGDGVNDGPALASADIGIAVRRAHSAARSTASIVLQDGIADILLLRDISRRSRDTVRTLLIATVTYNVAAGILAAFGMITPVLAALLMAVSSIATTAYGLQTMVKRPLSVCSATRERRGRNLSSPVPLAGQGS